jgi:dTDP-4-amino-4,6-dideoxygalactose transaminase
MTPIVELARLHNFVVIEDCAQAYVGNGYRGHPDSDCALFSFGPIKTATALGGAVVRLRDRELRARMIELQRTYPVQSRGSYLRRVAKYAAFRMLCKPLNYGLLVRALAKLRKDYDRVLGNAAHSFAASNFFEQIRRQPCGPLLRLLRRRIGSFSQRGQRQLGRRTDRGDRLVAALPPGMVVGGDNPTHTFWVAPVRVANPDDVAAALRRAGYDATRRSSLIVVPPGNGAGDEDRPIATWLNEIVFVPNGNDMPEQEWQRLVAILQKVGRPATSRASCELVALSGAAVTT